MKDPQHERQGIGEYLSSSVLTRNPARKVVLNSFAPPVASPEPRRGAPEPLEALPLPVRWFLQFCVGQIEDAYWD